MFIAAYLWCIKSASYVSPVHLLHCFRIYDVIMCDACTATYVLRILSAHIKTCSTLAYKEYELHIEEYELRMYDVRATYLSYLDTL